MLKKFKSPHKEFRNFTTTRRPRSPSPKRKDYNTRALTKDDNKSKCTYISSITHKRCKNLLGLYPQFCEMHTLEINNLFIAKSLIKDAGNGLYSGSYGFQKGDIIGQYSFPWNFVNMKSLERRCKNDRCYSYVLCDDSSNLNANCWDGLDIRSTLVRNANDAHNSQFRNNAYFEIIKNQVYMVASRNIKPFKEIYVSYGKSFWS